MWTGGSNFAAGPHLRPEDDAEAEVMQSEYGLEFQQINQPISISMPAECTADQTDQS